MDYSNGRSKMAKLTILFSGDFCPINRTRQLILDGKTSEIFRNISEDLEYKDLSVTNLEGQITTRKTPIEKSGVHLKIHPKAIELLKAGNFDIVNLANNHIMDYGSDGLAETLELLKLNGIYHVGVGCSIYDAQKPLRIQRDGKSIEFLAFAENEFNVATGNRPGVWPLSPATNIFQIREARKRSDIVIVMIHGGNELCPVPSPRIIETYRAFADAGASAVIGTHPHVPQGFETHGGSLIFYSLGNLTFDHFPERKRWLLWFKTYLARIHFQGNYEQPEIVPLKASQESGLLSHLPEKEQDEFLDYIDFLSKMLKKEEDIRKYWNAWCAWTGPRLLQLSALSSPPALMYKMTSRRFPTSRFFLFAMNLLTCDAHRDLLSTYMDLIRTKEIEDAREDIPLVKELQQGKIPK